jgi:hypothetical protein
VLIISSDKDNQFESFPESDSVSHSVSNSSHQSSPLIRNKNDIFNGIHVINEVNSPKMSPAHSDSASKTSKESLHNNKILMIKSPKKSFKRKFVKHINVDNEDMSSNNSSVKSLISEKHIKDTVGRIKISNMDLVFKDLQHLSIGESNSGNTS